MVLLLAFAACLLIAVLVSERAHRRILSTAVLFLLTGVVVGEGMLFHLAALVIAASIVAHSSTDVLVAPVASDARAAAQRVS